uniref:A disintegrin and metalloproteinase with thrombospondin motifs 9 n=1 Tax=Sphaerodactylus townsendi TaxID=933632 RepID=A0ACB8EH16_9SAUR
MQLALWAVGLSTLLLQDFLNVAGATARIQGLHPRQAKLLDALSEYEIVTPTRVNEFGEPFSAKVHFQRTKRSLPLETEPWGLDATSSSSSSSSSATQTHYKLSAFGQHFFFNLTAHAGFIAPLFTVSFLGEPGVNQTNFYAAEESDIKHCFYRGHVNTKPQHTAVISLCSGMVSVWFGACFLWTPPFYLQNRTTLSDLKNFYLTLSVFWVHGSLKVLDVVFYSLSGLQGRGS